MEILPSDGGKYVFYADPTHWECKHEVFVEAFNNASFIMKY